MSRSDDVHLWVRCISIISVSANKSCSPRRNLKPHSWRKPYKVRWKTPKFCPLKVSAKQKVKDKMFKFQSLQVLHVEALAEWNLLWRIVQRNRCIAVISPPIYLLHPPFSYTWHPTPRISMFFRYLNLLHFSCMHQDEGPGSQILLFSEEESFHCSTW